MAARKGVPNSGQFKKGHVANPLGGGAHDPEVRAVRNLTRRELAEVGSLVVKGDITALTTIKNDPNSSAMHAIIASVCLRAWADGDMRGFDVLLNRLIGKVKDEVALSGSIGGGAQVIVTVPQNGREAPPEATTPPSDAKP